MVRRAKVADMHAIGELIRAAWEMSHPYPVNELKLKRTVHTLMSNKLSVIFVSDIDGEVKGVISGRLMTPDVADVMGAASDVWYCTSGEGGKLVKAYVKWAKEAGAKMVNFEVASGNLRADKLIERCGFRKAGGNFYL